MSNAPDDKGLSSQNVTIIARGSSGRQVPVTGPTPIADVLAAATPPIDPAGFEIRVNGQKEVDGRTVTVDMLVNGGDTLLLLTQDTNA